MQFADGSPDIRVERRAGAWVLPAKAGYPADRLRLSALLEALAEARKVEAKSANPKNHALLGLAERGEGQALRLSLLRQSGEPLVLLVGKDAQHGGSFVRRLGDPQAWLIDKRLPVQNNELEADRHAALCPGARTATALSEGRAPGSLSRRRRAAEPADPAVAPRAQAGL